MNLYAYAGNNPVSFGDPYGLCKVDVRYSKLGGKGKRAWHHVYIVTTDPNGGEKYFRGGPSSDGPSGGASGATTSGTGGTSGESSGSNSSGSSNSANSSSPGSSRGGPGQSVGSWGSIATESGDYQPGTIDYETGNPSQTVLDNDDSCDSYNAGFDKALGDIQRAGIPYNPFSSNSNAVVRTVLERSGITPPKPSAWAPGWKTKLLP